MDTTRKDTTWKAGTQKRHNLEGTQPRRDITRNRTQPGMGHNTEGTNPGRDTTQKDTTRKDIIWKGYNP